MLRRTLFHTPHGTPPSQEVRTEIVEPILGLNRQRPATNLRPGETPFSQNWVMGDKYIEPRSGLSRFNDVVAANTYLAGDVPLYAAFASDLSGVDVAYIISQGTIIQHAEGFGGSSWTVVGGQRPSSSTKNFSDLFAGIFDHAVVFDSATSQKYIVLVNGQGMPLKIPIKPAGNASASIISSFVSAESFARYADSYDNRLVLFSSGKTGDIKQQRVRWSARGSPFDFTNGGFEDLVDMQGIPSGMAATQDNLVLLTDREVWLGRARRDAYVFDFAPLHTSIGNSFPHSLQETSAGLIWLGDSFQLYRLIGNTIRRIGGEVRNQLEAELYEAQVLFSNYDATTNVYALYYSNTAGEYPTKALFLRVDTLVPSTTEADADEGAWFLQDFDARQLTAASTTNPNIASHNPAFLVETSSFVVSSKATPYRFLSTQTSDAGGDIDCRWRSHALRADRDVFRTEMFTEFWVEYEYNSAATSSLSLYVSSDNAASFVAAGSISIVSGVYYAMIPVSSSAAAHNQVFELRLNDGTRPRIARMQSALRGYSGRQVG